MIDASVYGKTVAKKTPVRIFTLSEKSWELHSHKIANCLLPQHLPMHCFDTVGLAVECS
jgi:hypothetical protein